jgi:hypothetical protein
MESHQRSQEQPSYEGDVVPEVGWAYGLSVGFIPWNPMFWAIQFAIFIVSLLVLIFVFKVGIGWSFFLAYLIQAGLIAVSIEWVMVHLLPLVI